MSSAPDFIYPKNGLPKPDPDVQNSRVKINTAKVKSMDDLTHDTIKLVLECDKNSSPLSGKAGQFATIKVEGVRKPRAYSLAKSPKNVEAMYDNLIPKLQKAAEVEKKELVIDDIEIKDIAPWDIRYFISSERSKVSNIEVFFFIASFIFCGNYLYCHFKRVFH